VLLEWDHDAAGEAAVPSWAREATAEELRRPMRGQHGPATRRALQARRAVLAVLLSVVVVGVVGAWALMTWAGVWRR
jgi:hypothetical protein